MYVLQETRNEADKVSFCVTQKAGDGYLRPEWGEIRRSLVADKFSFDIPE